MNEQEVRAIAAKATSICFTKMGTNNPYTFVDVAEMMEAYIQMGGTAAREVIRSWQVSASESISEQPQGEASPQVTHATSEGDSPTDPRAQELAEEAYLVKDRAQLKPLIQEARVKGIGEVEVSICGKQGPLSAYLSSRWSALSPNSSTPLYARNKKAGPPPSVSAIRSDLGL